MPSKKKASPTPSANAAATAQEEKPKAKRKTKEIQVLETDGQQHPAATTTPRTHAPGTENATAGNQGGQMVPGVRPKRTRPYLAGAIIARHGLTAGITAGMVEELDEAYGKPNPRESEFCLKNAHHAARGYLGLAEDAIA